MERLIIFRFCLWCMSRLCLRTAVSFLGTTFSIHVYRSPVVVLTWLGHISVVGHMICMQEVLRAI